ncbi:hypothetical protein HMPREF9344_00181 [Cutibacterium acnes HL097PA1]|nr:hypothetical protein HMPREF9344_00181 [Cutibacterium acnes HL097PA1]
MEISGVVHRVIAGFRGFGAQIVVPLDIRKGTHTCRCESLSSEVV